MIWARNGGSVGPVHLKRTESMLVRPQKTRFEEALELECGRVLKPFELAYESYGTLNQDRDNAVLVCHGLTGDGHAAGRHHRLEGRVGWWDATIGPGKPFDTDRFFVVCSNVIGGCDGSTGPSSIDPETGRPYGLRFPVVTVGDMVEAQVRLADRLGIDSFHSLAGGCMGGFQVLEWMTRYPARVRNAIVISSTARVSTHTLGLWEVMRQAIMRDPAFNGGDYYGGELPHAGFGVAQMVGMMTWMSREVMEQRFGRRIRGGDVPSYTIGPEFEFQHFLHELGRNAAERFDANSLIYLTKAMDYFDFARTSGDLAEAFSSAKARTLLVSYASDWRYPPEEMEEIRVALQKAGVPVEHVILESAFGHGAFSHDSEGLGNLVREFLASSGLREN